MQSPLTEAPKPSVKMEQRGRILGIGGVFFNSGDRDLDGLLNRLKQEGVKKDAKRMNVSFGRFACIYDPNGNKD